MRWIVIVLLMCNGIYFIWQSLQMESAEVAANIRPASSDGAQLVLLSERTVDSAARSELRQSAPGQTALPVAVVQPDSATAVDRSEQAREPVTEVVQAQAVDAPSICWLIGPFKEQISGKQVIARLEALDIKLQLQKLELEGEPDYWVHIPPQVSRQAAIKLLRELQAKKIDSFLITEGELANGISLGFFTQKERADKVYTQRVKQGYEAKIKVVPRTYSELWAVFDTGEYGKFSDLLWDKIREGNQGLERRKNYCDKIASLGKLD